MQELIIDTTNNAVKYDMLIEALLQSDLQVHIEYFQKDGIRYAKVIIDI